MIPRRPVAIANEIRLKRSQHKGAFLVVEGRDDRLFCNQFIATSTCNIVVAEGKENVCEVIRILDGNNFLGVLGIVDADFDRIEGSKSPSTNIILTETHDLETMLIQSTSLDRVLIELGSDNKIKTFGCDIREALITAALPIGYLRLYSRQKGFNLRFERLNYSTCINAQSLEVDRQRLVQEVKNRSQRPELSPAELEIAMQSLESVGNDPWQICTGDDLISILSIGLRRALGTNPASTVRPEELRRSLRLAFGDNEFASSQLLGRFESGRQQTLIFASYDSSPST